MINGKRYIGKHSFKTLENSYLGSGFGLKAAIKKYGRENFTKQIVSVFETEDEAYDAEKMLIEQNNAIKDPTFYNRVSGGRGGAAERILPEEHKKKISNSLKGRNISESHKRNISKAKKITPTGGAVKGSTKSESMRNKLSISRQGFKHSDETKLRIKEIQSGPMNNQLGTKWINDGNINKKIKGEELPDGWSYGKISKPYKKRKL